MLSIDNTYSYDEVREWDARVRKGSPRASRSLRRRAQDRRRGRVAGYENGVFVLGATRGDGERGDDVTHNLRTIRDSRCAATTSRPPLFEVRGEVYMTNSDLVRLNERGGPRGDAVANPATPRPARSSCSTRRSAASGGCGSSPTGWASSRASRRPRTQRSLDR